MMIIEKHKLSRGGELTVLGTDKFKTETLTITLTLKSDQRKGRLASLLFGILKRGCVAYPDVVSLNSHLDDLYDTNISTMYARTGESVSLGFAVECLDRKCIPDGEDVLAGALETLREMLLRPLLDENGLFRSESLEREKKNLCDSIRASDNDPKVHSYQLCRGMLFEGEEYGKRSVGTVEDVMAVTPEEVTEFYREILCGPAPIFFYVGARECGEIKALAEDFSENMGCGSSDKCETLVRAHCGEARFAEEEMSVLQGKLTLGFRTDIGVEDPDLYGAIIFNDIFGGAPYSKLFQNVREKKSLCYYCSSGYDLFKGALFVRSGISNENKDTVIDEVMHWFEAIKNGDVSDYELECSKKSIENYYRQISDSPYLLESFHRSRRVSGMNISLEESIEKIKSVTKEDVIRASRRFCFGACAFVRGTLSGGEDACEEGEDDE